MIKQYDNAWSDVNKAQALGYQIHPEFLKALREAAPNNSFPYEVGTFPIFSAECSWRYLKQKHASYETLYILSLPGDG